MMGGGGDKREFVAGLVEEFAGENVSFCLYGKMRGDYT